MHSNGKTSLAAILFLMIAFVSDTPSASQDEAGVVAGITRSVNSVNAGNLRNTVLHLEQYGTRFTWEKQWETARWAAAELEKFGVKATLQTYEHNNKQWPNVVVEMRGRSRPDEIILAIAHLDSIADNPGRIAPGADDDGSGVAAVVEMARILAGIPLERTLMLCLFTNEEVGHVGSKKFAAEARRRALNIQAVVNLDVLGYSVPRKAGAGAIIRSHRTVKHKLKASLRMAVNHWKSFFSPEDRIRVAGRNEDAKLVSSISRIVRQYSDLRVQELSGGGCG